jgi:hypothetical protein
MGRQPEEADVLPGLLFMALCNIALYGVIVYAVLSMLSLFRRKQLDYEPLPPPAQKPY